MSTDTFLEAAPARALTALEKAEAIEILGDEHYEEAGSLLNDIKAFQAEVMKSTKPIVSAAHEAHVAAKAQQNDFLAPGKEAATLLGRKMGDYQAEMDRQRLHEQRIAQEALDKQVQAEVDEFAEGIVDDNVELAMAMTENAKAPVVKLPSLAPKVKGTQVRKTWHFEVTDKTKLPLQYLMPNEKAIGALVRTLKEEASITGVRVWFETHVH